MNVEGRWHRYESRIREDHRKLLLGIEGEQTNHLYGSKIPGDVLASVKDPTCKAWKLKLNGRQNVDPTTLVPARA